MYYNLIRVLNLLYLEIHTFANKNLQHDNVICARSHVPCVGVCQCGCGTYQSVFYYKKPSLMAVNSNLIQLFGISPECTLLQ